MAYEERKAFFENLKILVKSEYEEVFRILKKYNESYTENSNGIFFDVNLLKDETFGQLKEYMQFCLENRRLEEGRSKQLANLSAETNQYLATGYVSD
jgi:hypothetical protein